MKCIAGAKLVKTEGKFSCECLDGFFMETKLPLKCTACDPSCTKCAGSGSNLCTDCIPNAKLVESAVSLKLTDRR